MDETTTQLLLGLIATLVAGLIWSSKHSMRQNDRLVTSLEKAVNAFSAFRDDIVEERSDQQLVNGAMIADLKQIVNGVATILEVSERILQEMRVLNGKPT